MSSTDTSLLPAYLERTGVPRPSGPSIDALRSLHTAHVAAIPFENLDILLGRGVSLDLDRLRAKLVDQRRGGYCFEQNTLFQTVLRELGFAVTPMEARVRVGSSAIRPRTHMVLAVQIDTTAWLVDVGFGGEGPLEPVPLHTSVLDDAREGAGYRVVEEGPVRVLQMQSPTGWIDLYAFVHEAVHPVDFEVANWFTSTHPQSPFVRTLTAQRTTPSVRYVLRYPTYSEICGFDVRTRTIARGDLHGLLRDVFLIDVPVDVRFEAIDGPLVELTA